MVVRMKKLYDLVSKPTAVRKLSCSDCMTATKAFRKSLGVILFIACLKSIVASIAHCAVGFERHGVKGSAHPEKKKKKKKKKKTKKNKKKHKPNTKPNNTHPHPPPKQNIFQIFTSNFSFFFF